MYQKKNKKQKKQKIVEYNTMLRKKIRSQRPSKLNRQKTKIDNEIVML